MDEIAEYLSQFSKAERDSLKLMLEQFMRERECLKKKYKDERYFPVYYDWGNKIYRVKQNAANANTGITISDITVNDTLLCAKKVYKLYQRKIEGIRFAQELLPVKKRTKSKAKSFTLAIKAHPVLTESAIKSLIRNSEAQLSLGFRTEKLSKIYGQSFAGASIVSDLCMQYISDKQLDDCNYFNPFRIGYIDGLRFYINDKQYIDIKIDKYVYLDQFFEELYSIGFRAPCGYYEYNFYKFTDEIPYMAGEDVKLVDSKRKVYLGESIVL